MMGLSVGIPPSALPGISPTRGEIEKMNDRLSATGPSKSLALQGRRLSQSPPLWGRCREATEGGVLARPASHFTNFAAE
jgi:hypothetical protein